MDAALIINGIVIVLLAATIFYAFRLERRLEAVRNTQSALADVIRELNSATARAEAGLRGLKLAAESSGQALDDRIKRARSVGDELGMLLQAGQRLAQKIDAARPAPSAAPRPQTPAAGQALRAFGATR